MIPTNATGKVTCNFCPSAEHSGRRLERNLPCPEYRASPHTVATNAMPSELRGKDFHLLGNPILSKLEPLRDVGQDLSKNATMPYSTVFIFGS